MYTHHAGQTQAAMNLARSAIQAASSLRPAYLLLARCYIECRQLRQALITLNLMPCPPNLENPGDYQVRAVGPCMCAGAHTLVQALQGKRLQIHLYMFALTALELLRRAFFYPCIFHFPHDDSGILK